MNRVKIMIIIVVGICLMFSIGQVKKDLYAAEIDYERGIVLSEEVAGGNEPQATTCTLTITPNTVTNGQVFTVEVSYNPCLNIGTWTERFIFNWPSNLQIFDEKTVHQKMFNNLAACVISSSERVVVPSATSIKGTFDAKVKVSGVCSASAPLTVQ